MRNMLFSFCGFIFLTTNLLSQQTDFPKLAGPYLGQKPPGSICEIFTPKIISTTDNYEFKISFTLDGKYLFYTSYRRPIRAFPEQPITYNEIIRIINEPLNSSGNIYWINTEIISQIKNNLYKQ